MQISNNWPRWPNLPQDIPISLCKKKERKKKKKKESVEIYFRDLAKYWAKVGLGLKWINKVISNVSRKSH